jgi:hypothetical protein
MAVAISTIAVNSSEKRPEINGWTLAAFNRFAYADPTDNAIG